MAVSCKSFFSLLFSLLCVASWAQQQPKREFRGAWIQTVNQSQYQQMNSEQMQHYFIEILDKLKSRGINAVIFQVRPQADAFYKSDIEPWSRFVTGTQGNAPSPQWDPLTFMIEACHQRNIELHAWLNPYRVTNGENEKLARGHIYFSHPEWFVKYGKQIYFDPGLPESRNFILSVVEDLINRYDLDAIHMDDYFYPYPIAKQAFPDQNSFARYGNDMTLGDWRRSNVNMLIENIHTIIARQKPWIRFGISSFGIHRNQRSDPAGSNTNGLQNYDDLYADVLLWTQKGWVDYLVPQLYWEIGHKAACSQVLTYWWNKNANNRHMYIGQNVRRTQDAPDLNPNYTQLDRKMQLSRYLDNVHGNCFWSGYDLLENYKGVADALQADYFTASALIPAYDFIDDIAPNEVEGLKARWTHYGYSLQWKRKDTRDEMQKQLYFCVYRFLQGEPIDLTSARHLVATTRKPSYILPYQTGECSYVYVVTAVDRMHNESPDGVVVRVQL